MTIAARLLLSASFLLIASGCAAGRGDRPVPVEARLACPAGAESWARTELYMGLSRPDGSVIGDADFQGFVDREVTPRFPDGLTLFAGSGQWRGDDGTIVKEGSRVLVLLHPETPEVEGALEAVRDAYIEQFAQESVLRVDGASCVSF